MMPEEALYAHLAADANVSALVGSRIYPLLLPQRCTLPAIAYQRISRMGVHAHTGPSGLARCRIQYTCVGRTYAEVKSVATAVRQALDGLRGDINGLQVSAVFVDSEQDEFAFATKAVAVRMDVIVWYQET